MLNLRKLHRTVAPILFLPLFLTALTGVVYRLGESWFALPEAIANVLMPLHEGRFLGRPLVPIYVLLMGLGLLGLIVTGFVMFKRRPSNAQPKKDRRWFHRLLALIAFLPLLVSAMTGMAYRLGRAWFGVSKESAELLMRIHQGAYLGSVLMPFYVLLVGASLIGLLITGIRMTSLFHKRTPPSSNDA